MKKCLDCNFVTNSPTQYTCPKCGAKLESQIHQASSFSENCEQCGNPRARDVTLGDKKQVLCFYCFQKIRSRDFFSAPQEQARALTLAEEYERFALTKINEANYLRSDDMLGKATRLYQLSTDLKLGINSDLSSLMESLARDLQN